MLKQGWYNKEITCNKYFPICSTVVICRVGCELMIGFKISIFLILTPALSRTLAFFLFLDLFNFFNFFNFNFNFLIYFFLFADEARRIQKRKKKLWRGFKLPISRQLNNTCIEKEIR